MNQGESDTSHDELINKYLEREATPAEEEQFRSLLGNEEFCRHVAEYAIDLGHLYDHARPGMLERTLASPRKSSGRRRRHVPVLATVASVVLAVTALWLVLRHQDSPGEVAEQKVEEPVSPDSSVPTSPPAGTVAPAQRVVIARVDSVNGQVLIGDRFGSGPRRAIRGKSDLRSDDVLKTVGTEGFAVVRFDDGSIIAVAGETELTCSVVDSQKLLRVDGGDIMAQVAPQPEKPMVIETPTAEAKVVGTRLSLFASIALTELAVLEGHVQLRRLLDNQTIEVKKGQCAVASETTDLVAEPIGPVASVWEEGFEEAWPRRWRSGHWIHYGLPPGSKGGVLAASRDDEGGPCFISSPNEWYRGLFRIEEDSHLNVTYKLRWPGWFYIMLETRSEDYSGAYRGHYMYQTPELWKIPRNEWRTVSIPLRYFQTPRRALRDGAEPSSPSAGDVVFSLHFRTQEPDPGLFVDRVWVTRDAPSSAEVLPMRK